MMIYLYLIQIYDCKYTTGAFGFCLTCQRFSELYYIDYSYSYAEFSNRNSYRAEFYTV